MSGLPSSGLRLPGIHAVSSGLWQSALKLMLMSVAIRSTVILFMAIRGSKKYLGDGLFSPKLNTNGLI
jgi:hypothetical protein